MSYDLRPLSLAELLDRAFSLYRRHLLLFVGIMAPPAVAMLVANVVVQAFEFVNRSGAELESVQRVALAMTGIGIILLMTAVYFVSYAAALGATTAAVAALYKSEAATVGSSYGAMRGRIGRLCWLVLLIGLRIFLLTILLIVALGASIGVGSLVHPAVGILLFVVVALPATFVYCWLLLRYVVAVPPAVLEDMTAREAIRRSIDLTYGSRWRVAVLTVFVIIVSYAGLMLFQWPFLVAAVLVGPETLTGFLLNLGGVVTGTLASMVTTPLTVVAMAVLYYDLRIRKEGLDLDILIAGLRDRLSPGTAASPGAVLPG